MSLRFHAVLTVLLTWSVCQAGMVSPGYLPRVGPTSLRFESASGKVVKRFVLPPLLKPDPPVVPDSPPTAATNTPPVAKVQKPPPATPTPPNSGPESVSPGPPPDPIPPSSPPLDNGNNRIDPNVPSMVPTQVLVPFFMPKSNTNAQPAGYVPIGFTPGTPPAGKSSSATFTKD